MGFLSSLLEQRVSPESIARPLTAASLLDILGGPTSATGKRVSEKTAMQVAAVFACVRVLSESVASLPLPLFRRLERGKERAVNHPVYRLLHDQPNEWMTSYTLRETLQGHLSLWGNAFAEIDRDASGVARALYPLRPDRMDRPVPSQAGGLIYPYQLPSGEKKLLPQARVLHLKSLSSDGVWGYSIIGLQREAVALSMTAEEFAARFFGNNARPGGVLQVKGKLSDEAASRLKTRWEMAHQGLSNAHRVAVLEEGTTWQQLGMPLQDAQFLELRKYQRSEIASVFRMPPHLIGDLERATFSNIEQQSLEFVIHTLRPWLVNWEQQLSASLLLPFDIQQGIFAEFVIEGLLRGDATARSQFYSTLFNIGSLSPNDIRELENLNPVPDGDKYFVQGALVPIDQAGQQPQPPAPGGPPAQRHGTVGRPSYPKYHPNGLGAKASKAIAAAKEHYGTGTIGNGIKIGQKVATGSGHVGYVVGMDKDGHPKVFITKPKEGGPPVGSTVTGDKDKTKPVKKDNQKFKGSESDFQVNKPAPKPKAEPKPAAKPKATDKSKIDAGYKGDTPPDYQAAWKKKLAALPSKEREGLRAYTGGAYIQMNGHLRHGELVGKPIQDAVDGAKSALSKLKLDRDHILYRGTPSYDWVSKLVPGFRYTDKGFHSTSTGQSTPESFDGAAVLRIVAKKGTKGAYVESISNEPHEREVILAPGTKFRVIGDGGQTKYGKKIIDVVVEG